MDKKLKIISGAQTGVDRAALDAALESNVPCGGWCPAGRRAEDGVIPARYPVEELEGSAYRQRTRKNVQDSDGTVMIYFAQLSGGTEQTLRFCLSEHKPYLLIDGQEVRPERAAERIHEFLRTLNGKAFNVAGPRASGDSRAYEYAHMAIKQLIHLWRTEYSA